MFGPSLAQVVGAATLLSAADRLPPRAALTGLALLFALGTAALALPGLPVWAVFALLLGLGAVAVAGRRRALRTAQRDPRPGGLSAGPLGAQHVRRHDADLRVRGRRRARDRPVAARHPARRRRTVPRCRGRRPVRPEPAAAAGRRAALGRRDLADNARLWSSAPRRYVYLALWVPNGLIVGCESLFVPYAPRHAGLLFACRRRSACWSGTS